LKRKLWRKKKNKEGARYIFHDNWWRKRKKVNPNWITYLHTMTISWKQTI
jgi:hypothetical protein